MTQPAKLVMLVLSQHTSTRKEKHMHFNDPMTTKGENSKSIKGFTSNTLIRGLVACSFIMASAASKAMAVDESLDAAIILHSVIPDVAFGLLTEIIPSDFMKGESLTYVAETDALGWGATVTGSYLGKDIHVVYSGDLSTFSAGLVTWHGAGTYGTTPWTSSGQAVFTVADTSSKIAYSDLLNLGGESIGLVLTLDASVDQLDDGGATARGPKGKRLKHKGDGKTPPTPPTPPKPPKPVTSTSTTTVEEFSGKVHGEDQTTILGKGFTSAIEGTYKKTVTTVVTSSIPEPGTIPITVAGLGVTFLAIRKRRPFPLRTAIAITRDSTRMPWL